MAVTQKVGLQAWLRCQELLTIKTETGLTWPELAKVTGFHQVSLRQWGNAMKPMTLSALRQIRLTVENVTKIVTL